MKKHSKSQTITRKLPLLCGIFLWTSRSLWTEPFSMMDSICHVSLSFLPVACVTLVVVGSTRKVWHAQKTPAGTRRKYCAEMSLKPQSFGLRPIVPAHTLVLHWISVDLSRAHTCCPHKAESELNIVISLQYMNKSWEIAFPTAHDVVNHNDKSKAHRRFKLLYTSGATSGQFLCWQHLVWQANTVCLRIEALGCDLSFKQNPKHNVTKMCAKLQLPILLKPILFDPLRKNCQKTQSTTDKSRSLLISMWSACFPHPKYPGLQMIEKMDENGLHKFCLRQRFVKN